MNQGTILAIASFAIWGMFPLYWNLFSSFDSMVVLAVRIILSFLSLGIILSLLNKWQGVKRLLASPKDRKAVFLSATLISINWFVFIYGIAEQRVLETSLGYFMGPIFNVLIGTLCLGEKLRGRQKLSLALVFAAVLLLATTQTEFPWIAISLATSFSFYGFIHKQVKLPSLEGLTIETLLATPVCIGLLFYFSRETMMILDQPSLALTLSLGGIITIIPLLLFNMAAQKIPFTSLGMIQYLTPTCHFLIANFVFHEPLNTMKLVSFILIWTALFFYSMENIIHARRLHKLATT